eukprot:18444-Ditylum_brightwellii.AAC.1
MSEAVDEILVSAREQQKEVNMKSTNEELLSTSMMEKNSLVLEVEQSDCKNMDISEVEVGTPK